MKLKFALRGFRDWRTPGNLVTTRYGDWGSTCGSAALAMIVDDDPEKIERFAGCSWGKPFGIPDAQRVLKKYGFESHPFYGPQSLVNLGREAYWASDELTHDNLILFTADTTKEDASWFVAHAGVIYHNGRSFSNSPLFGLTNPLIDLLLVRRKRKR